MCPHPARPQNHQTYANSVSQPTSSPSPLPYSILPFLYCVREFPVVFFIHSHLFHLFFITLLSFVRIIQNIFHNMDFVAHLPQKQHSISSNSDKATNISIEFCKQTTQINFMKRGVCVCVKMFKRNIYISSNALLSNYFVCKHMFIMIFQHSCHSNAFVFRTIFILFLFVFVCVYLVNFQYSIR